MKGIIIGAGIGGLTTAIALESQGKGIETQIFEAAPELSVKGAGILIPPNAMAVLAQYNLVEQLKPFAQPIQSMVIMNVNGETSFLFVDGLCLPRKKLSNPCNPQGRAAKNSAK